MAEKEGFEPSIPFWGIHDFQSCALGQLRDFSKSCGQLAYITAFVWICQVLNLKIFYIVVRDIKFRLTQQLKVDIIAKFINADVAQSVEHLTRNEKVTCSSHAISSS